MRDLGSGRLGQRLQNFTADVRLRMIMEAYIGNLKANNSLFLKLTQDMLRALIDEGMRVQDGQTITVDGGAGAVELN